MADKFYNIDTITGTITIPTSDTVKMGTTTLGEVNGVTQNLIFVTPNMEATNSTRFQLYTKSGKLFYDSGTKAESTTTVVGTALGLSYGDYFVGSAEGTQSASRDTTFEIRLIR